MQDPSLDTSASSQLLMEDVHQGVTSAAAARTIDRYRQFVQAQRAPVARMHYSPFAKQTSEGTINTAADDSHTATHRSSLFHSQNTHAAAKHRSALDKSGAAADSNTNGIFAHVASPCIRIRFSEAQLLDESIVPASSTHRDSHSSAHSSGFHSARSSVSSSAASSRAHSPNRDTFVFDDAGVEGRDPYHPLNPPVPHTSTGGAAWTVDFNNFNDKNLSSKEAAVGSKRGSALSSSASSRKSSLNAGDPKLWATADQGRIRGHESAQQIWAMQGPVSGQRSGSDSHRSDSDNSSLRAKAHRVNEVLNHAAHAHESQSDSVERLSVPTKRLSLKQPFLRAHTHDQAMPSAPIANAAGAPKEKLTHTLNQPAGAKSKRSSMPPLQNKKGFLTAGAGGGAGARRGSVTKQSQRAPQSTASSSLQSRQRSQSLPTDSLFLAYSQCALPAVLTSSLASMPVPSHPAIPVEVARRYSVLTALEGIPESTHMPPTSSPTPPLREDEDGTEPGMVHVNPESVEGIDTSSVLDTTQLHDMVDEGSLEDAGVPPVPQPARRGSLSRAVALVLSSESMQSSPASSPIAPDSSPSEEGTFHAPSSSSLAALPSFPECRAEEKVVQSPESADKDGAVGSKDGSAPTSARSRSLIHTKRVVGPVGRKSLSIVAAPSRDQVVLSTPDYTPMTSPTNLGAAVFRSTLMNRRMSEVVARDLGKKLRILKKHMEESARAQEEQEASGISG